MDWGKLIDGGDVVMKEGVKAFWKNCPPRIVKQGVKGRASRRIEVEHLLDDVLLSSGH